MKKYKNNISGIYASNESMANTGAGNSLRQNPIVASEMASNELLVDDDGVALLAGCRSGHCALRKGT